MIDILNLKPCPFCGDSTPSHYDGRVCCGNPDDDACDAGNHNMRVEHWNTRHNPINTLVINEIRNIAETGCLPDGTKVDVSTQLWAERAVTPTKAAVNTRLDYSCNCECHKKNALCNYCCDGVQTKASDHIGNVNEMVDNTATIKRLAEALGLLLEAKSYKEKNGKTPVYEDLRRFAWRKAERVISTLPEEFKS